MAFYEGKGEKAPSPVLIQITKEDERPIRIQAARIAHLRGYNQANTLVGLLGEGALSLYLLEQLHFPYAMNALVYEEAGVYGDGGVDCSLYGLAIQVKTHRKGKDCQIPRFRKGKFVSVLSDGYYVFCELATSGHSPITQVLLLGYIKANKVLKYGEMRVYDNNSVLVINPKYLERMDRFIVLAQNQKELEML